MLKGKMRVNGKDGLHAGPEAEFIQLFKKIKSDVKGEDEAYAIKELLNKE